MFGGFYGCNFLLSFWSCLLQEREEVHRTTKHDVVAWLAELRDCWVELHGLLFWASSGVCQPA